MIRREGGFEEDGNVKSEFGKTGRRRYQFGLKPIEGNCVFRMLFWQLHVSFECICSRQFKFNCHFL